MYPRKFSCVIPDEILTPIMFQRTELKQLLKEEICWVFGCDAYDIAKALDHAPDRVLDIGAGLGLLDIALSRLWPKARFTLLDDDPSTNHLTYGYKEDTEIYSSIHLMERTLLSNDLRSPDFEVVRVREIDSIKNRRFDLVISTISWCWHYPASVYVDFVKRALVKGGHLIVDVRDKTDSEAALIAAFGEGRKIKRHERGTRILFTNS